MTTILYNKLKILICKVMDVELQASIELCDLDSFEKIQFTKEINDSFNINLDYKIVFSTATLEELASKIDINNKSIEVSSSELSQEKLPLTQAQISLLFIDDIVDLPHVYNVYRILKLNGRINVDRLSDVIRKCVERHSVLQGCFCNDQSGIYFNINKNQNIDVKLRETTAVVVDQKIQDCITAKFNLYTGPLYRIEILQLNHSFYYCIVVAHHSVIDGWSMTILINEIIARYKKLPIVNDEAENKYIEYALEQSRIVTSQFYKRHSNFWKSEFENAQQVSTLSKRNTRERSSHGKMVYFSLNNNTLMRLQSYITSSPTPITLSSYFLSVLYVQIYIFNNRFDSTIGVTYFGRQKKKYDDAVGYFSNVLPLRIKFENDCSFSELLKYVSNKFTDILSYSDISFGKICEILNYMESNHDNPLFQIMYNYQKNIHRNEISEVDSIVEHLAHNHTAKFDLTLFVWKYEHHVQFGFEYSTERFDDESIQIVISNYLALLENSLNSPTIKLMELANTLSSYRGSYVSLMFGENKTYDLELSLYDLLAKQAVLNKENVALVDKYERLTFHEFIVRVDQLANYLSNRGVSQGEFIGLSIERSCYSVIAIFALVKLGAIFVPLDPNYPQSRIEYMIEDSKVRCILIHGSFSENLNNYSNLLIDITGCWKQTSSRKLTLKNKFSPIFETKQDDILYLLYTSGSTGQPKGVLGVKRGLLNRCYWMWETYPFKAHDVYCHKTSNNFVDSIWEIFGALLQGIKLVIIDEAELRNIRKFKEKLNEETVSHLVLVPSLLQTIIEDRNLLQHLRVCISSGEPLTTSLVKNFYKSYPNVKLLNLYGSTEVAGDITCFDAQHLKQDATLVPVGLPISNTSIYILNEQLLPVPRGEIGVIYASGFGVAKGYWQKDEESEKKFIHNSKYNHLLYCLGDIGRLNSDGVLECLGRNDSQVKVRGVRIELGDITHFLLEHPKIKNAITCVVNDNQNVLILSYVIQREEVKETYISPEFRNYLINKLPYNSVPNAVIVINKFPMLPNGKVNSASLPRLFDVVSSVSVEENEHYTKQQKELLEIYSQLLQRPVTSIDNGFFQLGGNSLLTMRLTTILNDKYNISFSTKEIFTSSTIRNVSAKISEKTCAGDRALEKQELAVHPTDVSELSFSQNHVFMLERITKNQAVNLISLYFKINGEVVQNQLQKAFSILVQRHSIFRTGFYHDPNREIIQRCEANINFNLQTNNGYNKWSVELSEELKRISSQPFDLTSPPLFRVTLFNLKNDEHILLLNFHHLIIDGWSIRTLYEEVSEIYNSLISNQPITLDPALDYIAYIEWQAKSYLKSKDAQLSLEFWRDKLINQPLHLDKFSINYASSADLIIVKLDNRVVREIQNHVRESDVTPYMVILAAYLVQLASHEQKSEILVSTAVANRGMSEFQNSIGCFINTILVRQCITGIMSFAEVLENLKNYLVDAYDHQQLPFDYFMRENPSFKSHNKYMFIYQGFRGNFKINGQVLEENIIHNNHSRADLTLWIWEAQGTIRIGFEYRDNVYTKHEIECFSNNFKKIINYCLDSSTGNLQSYITQQNSHNIVHPKQVAKSKLLKRPSPPSGILFELIEMWMSLLNVACIKESDDFFELGGNSLLAMQLLSQLENKYKKEFSYIELFENSQLAAMVSYIGSISKINYADIFLLNQVKSHQNIFFIHPVTGLAYSYFQLANYLHDYNVYGINHPGFFTGHISFKNMNEMARYYLSLILKYQSAGPFIIAGWSFGGVVAYEVAHLLNELGLNDIHVFMFDSFNLNAFNHKQWTNEIIADHIASLNIHKTHAYYKQFINMVNCNNQLLREYVPPVINANVTLFKASLNSDLFVEMQNDSMNGWKGVIKNNFTISCMQVKHEEMFLTSNMNLFANAIVNKISKDNNEHLQAAVN